jgi:enoyl-CoA hydratase
MSTQMFAGDTLELTLGRIAHLSLNRPRLANAINAAMWCALLDVCATVARSAEARVLVISGNGRNFCAGADISEFEAIYASDETAERYNDNYRAVEDAIRGLSIPVIAQIRGACVGGGLGLALAADFRFADPSVRISVSASKLGLAYSAEDSSSIIEKIGPVNAKDMLYSARMIDATEAHAWGLLDRVVSSGELSAAVQAYASILAERSRAALSATKTIVDSLMAPNPDLCARLKPIYSSLFRQADLVEGRKAFLEKREPRFE